MKEDVTMFRSRIAVFCFVALAMTLASSAQDAQVFKSPNLEEFSPLRPQRGFYTFKLPDSMKLEATSTGGGRRRVVAVSPLVPVVPAWATPGMGITTPEPDHSGHSASFTSWKPIAVSTVITAYYVKVDGRQPIPGMTTVVRPEDAEAGFAAWIHGSYSWKEPLPPGVTGYEVEFTGVGDTYSVSAPVPAQGGGGGSQSSSDFLESVEVFPDGMIFIKGSFPLAPVASLNGKGVDVVHGWITPPADCPDCVGSGVWVTVSTGYPKSVSSTRTRDIPVPIRK